MCTYMSNYPWQSIDPKDSIHIESDQTLTMQDVRILTKLYKPIIGGEAYSFYQSLFSELDFKANKKSTTVSKLLTKMDIGIADYYHARIRLEGIGLMKIYRSQEKENEYIYELSSPLSISAFFKDSLLRTLLIEKIGNHLFQEELQDLKIESYPKEKYEEMTHSFVDVFHFDVEKKEISGSNNLISLKPDKRPKLAKTIENVDSFDYDFFKKGLNKHFIRQDSLTGEIKELIYTYHLIYGIDELTMQEIVLESADVESGEVNKNKLTNTVQRMYLNKQKKRKNSNQSNNQTKGTQKSPEDLKEAQSLLKKDGFTASEISVINHAKKTAPGNYLRSIKEQKNGFITSNETWVLKELVEQSPLSKEVINIMLNYILVIQEAVVLEKNYAMKIANDWAQTDVETAEDAVVKLRKIFSERKQSNTGNQNKGKKKQYKSKYRKNRKKESLPDWAKAENTKEDELLSSGDGDALKDRLEQIRKQRELKEDN